MEEKLISIIVPVYNAEETVERCVFSLCTMPGLVEVICVDDGSRDSSGKILDNISEKMSNVIVIHQKNKGAAAARNKGLSFATGRYIMFCDSDDEYQNDTLSYIVEDIRNDMPDYIVFRREQELLSGEILIHAKGNSKTRLECSWDEYFNNILQEHGHCVSVFNKVYRRDIIQKYKISFDDELVFGEDLWFNLNYIPNVNSMIEDFRAIYKQHSTVGSLCTSRNDNFYDLNMQSVIKYRSFYPEKAKKIEIYFNKFTFIAGTIGLKRNFRIKNEYKRVERQQLFHSILDDGDFQKSLKYVSCMENVEGMEGIKRQAEWLMRGGFWGYSIRYFYLPQLKQYVKK